MPCYFGLREDISMATATLDEDIEDVGDSLRINVRSKSNDTKEVTVSTKQTEKED